MLSLQSEGLRRRIGRNVPASCRNPEEMAVPIKKQSRLAEYDAGGFATWVRMGKCPVQSGYRFRATLQRNSLVKLNASAAG
jgi:hypothetical protein